MIYVIKLAIIIRTIQSCCNQCRGTERGLRGMYILILSTQQQQHSVEMYPTLLSSHTILNSYPKSLTSHWRFLTINDKKTHLKKIAVHSLTFPRNHTPTDLHYTEKSWIKMLSFQHKSLYKRYMNVIIFT